MSATAAQVIAAVIALLGGAGGMAAFVRSRAQNTLDLSSSRRTNADTESIVVATARELVAEVRMEMDRKVTDLEREVGRLRGLHESTASERDSLRALVESLREVERVLRSENAALRARVEHLENRLAELEAAARGREFGPPTQPAT